LKQSPAAHRFIFQQDGAPAQSAQRMAVGQLSIFHCKGPVTSKFGECEPNGLSRVRCNVGAYSKLKTKLKTIAELKETLQVILGNLPQAPIDKFVKDFFQIKRMKACVGA